MGEQRGALDRSYNNLYIHIMSMEEKPVRWMGSSRKDLKTFPKPVQRDVGQAIYAAQRGEEYPRSRRSGDSVGVRFWRSLRRLMATPIGQSTP